jgi:hypothetical protein
MRGGWNCAVVQWELINTMKHLASICFFAMWQAGLLVTQAIEAADSPQAGSVKVKPCPNASRAPPIERECIAAAIAEAAFLRETQHKVSRYLISSLRPAALWWKIWIIEGDEIHPGADGAFWQVYVERSSGKIEIVPGR